MKKIALTASVAALGVAGYVLAAGSGSSGGAAKPVLLSESGPSAAAGIQTNPTTAATGGARVIAAAAGKGIPDTYICVFKKGGMAPSSVRGAAAEAVRRGSGALGHVYSAALQGFSVHIPAQAAQALVDRNPNIEWCEEDQIVSIVDPVTDSVGARAKPGGGTTTPPETTPAGILAVKGGQTYTGTGRAWVIDTGIDLAHPDLNVDRTRSANFVSRETSPQDLNGHGTHVAGTIAAKGGNGIGVVGVAAGAPVIAVRVLDRRGSGSNADVIAGIDYVAQNGIAGDVANMSLGGSVSTALDAAVLNASAVVKFALAAGNETDDANNHSPARQNGPNIYTIAAMNWNGTSGTWASFSNYNPAIVDFIEPGVNILSTWINGGYNTISGTSMATPHMAGLLLWGAPRAGGTVVRTGATDSYTIGIK